VQPGSSRGAASSTELAASPPSFAIVSVVVVRATWLTRSIERWRLVMRSSAAAAQSRKAAGHKRQSADMVRSAGWCRARLAETNPETLVAAALASAAASYKLL
jgi:hypothetical protein